VPAIGGDPPSAPQSWDPAFWGLARTDPVSPRGFEQGCPPRWGPTGLSRPGHPAAAPALTQRRGPVGRSPCFPGKRRRWETEQLILIAAKPPPGRSRAQQSHCSGAPRTERPGAQAARRTHRRCWDSFPPFFSPSPLPCTRLSRLLSHNGCQNTARQGIITDTYCGHYTTSTVCAK